MYFDPNNLQSTTKVKALYDYKPNHTDELNLVKNCVVTNVVKEADGWWKGDFGGKKQHWFPANHVSVLESSDNDDVGNDAMPLGTLQKGSFDVKGIETVDVRRHHEANPGDPHWLIFLENSQRKKFVVAAMSEDDANQWSKIILDTGQSALSRERKTERDMRIARELSNLVIYCRSVVFQIDKYQKREADRRICQEMSSFPETKAERIMMSSWENVQMILWYHQVQLSRIYPKAQRVDSSNYNPVPMWNVGSQMSALNFQTGDKPMQLNVARFLSNGNCGYVLRPEYMFRTEYNPSDPKTCDTHPLVLEVRVLAARHLTRKTGRGMISPYVEVEICGSEYDDLKLKTKTVGDNGFNPVWDETFTLTVHNAPLAMLR